jgi:acetyl esterase
MSLHPQVAELLKMFEQRGLLPLEEQELMEARTAFESSAKVLSKAENIVNTEDRYIKGFNDDIKIRIYSPDKEGPLPVLVYYHGGGWVIGTIESHDALCHSLSYLAECKVISVDYSLAPENRFPVAVEDAYLAVKWLQDHTAELGIDKDRIAVGGDSAGGNLAAVVSYLANQRNELQISYQLLFYPSTGFDFTESYEKYGDGYHLTKPLMKWFREQYLTSIEDTQNPLAAPMLIPDKDTASMPPAYILTAEYDPLCDGGEAFARKLQAARVATEYICYPGMIHGFLGMNAYLDDANLAIMEAAKHLKLHFEKELEGRNVR